MEAEIRALEAKLAAEEEEQQEFARLKAEHDLLMQELVSLCGVMRRSRGE